MSGRRRRAWLTAASLSLLVLAGAVLLLTAGSAHRPGRAAPTSSLTGPGAPTTSSSVSPTASATPPSSTTTTTVPAPAQPPPPGQEFGASVNLLFNSATSPPTQIATQLAALRATGATLARSDALWEASEPTAPVNGVHTYDWTFDDTIAADLAAHRLRWLPILGYSAPWAQSIPGQDHSPPSSDAAYAAYAGAFASRYGLGGSFWLAHPELPAEPVQTFEIWNEPDNAQFWTPTPDPARYAGLYSTARLAIDAADPQARVIVGGLTAPASFLPAMLTARPDLAGHIDGVAIHPYGKPPTVLARIRGARSTLTGLGLEGVPLYVTEFGWTTSPPGALDYVPAGRRPSYIAKTLAALGHLDCGIAADVFYTWFSPGQDPANSQEWYGIDALTGAATSDTAAFGLGLARARASGPATELCR